MGRRRNYNDPGHAHCFTFCCYRRLKLLNADRTRTWVCEAVDAARDELGWDVWAYVLMPEHVHLLACPRDHVYDVAAFRKAVKEPAGGTGNRVRQHLVSSGGRVALVAGCEKHLALRRVALAQPVLCDSRGPFPSRTTRASPRHWQSRWHPTNGKALMVP